MLRGFHGAFLARHRDPRRLDLRACGVQRVGQIDLPAAGVGGLHADGGQVTVAGEPVYENIAVKERIFFVADDLYFLPQSTLEEMATFYKQIYRRFSDTKYKKLCTIFPLDPRQKLGTFSKGMKRQAALLLALSCEPDLLLLDEAFDGLDPVMRGAVKKLLSDDIASREMTVVITSHNLRELEDLCDHVGLLHQGKILFERELDELKLGFCKVHAAFPQGMDDAALAGLNIMQAVRTGSLVTPRRAGKFRRGVGLSAAAGRRLCGRGPAHPRGGIHS